MNLPVYLPPLGSVRERANPKDSAIMVYIPQGEFLMGKEQRFVSVAAYWIYKTPVTVAQYHRFCRDMHHEMPQMPRWGWQDAHPVVNVSWRDAQAYCTWANARLPGKAEWEKAARGTDGREFPWGNVFDIGHLHCSKINWGDAGGTAPVGSYASGASPYGCLDMAGNVSEWGAEHYEDIHGTPEHKRNWRVLHGGSWRNIPTDFANFRAWFITANTPDGCNAGIGFRCVVTP